MSTYSFPVAPVDLFNEPAFSLGVFHARPAVREVEIDQVVERLEPRVFQVLVVLARSCNQTISRDALISQCWNGRFVSDDALNRTIGKLRRVFARDPSGSVTIETVPRLGYQMRASPAESPGRLPGNGDPGMEPDCRTVVSETLKEAGRLLGHALQAIELSALRGGAQLKLTIEMTTLECGVLQGASHGPLGDLNGLTSGLARYKEQNPR